MSRQEYQRVPNEETIEMKESGSTSSSSSPHPPKQSDEPPPSRGMVIFSVLFYLVAAIVVSFALFRVVTSNRDFRTRDSLHSKERAVLGGGSTRSQEYVVNSGIQL